jgi:hypothetical protein
MADEKRDTKQGQEWIFPVGFTLFWVVGGLAVLVIGMIALLNVAG